jgi:hypothetical protein
MSAAMISALVLISALHVSAFQLFNGVSIAL